jgi:hypothetical protein
MNIEKADELMKSTVKQTIVKLKDRWFPVGTRFLAEPASRQMERAILRDRRYREVAVVPREFQPRSPREFQPRNSPDPAPRAARRALARAIASRDYKAGHPVAAPTPRKRERVRPAWDKRNWLARRTVEVK